MQGRFLQPIQLIQRQTLQIKKMENETWKYIKEFIQFILKTVNSKLDKESIDSVNHYVDHDEYEMAFEGLFLEIMQLKEIPKIDWQKSKEVGELLKLNEESVFDFDFWNKFENYIKRNSRSLDAD